ncbi:MAG: carotenoid 1,2-hydratase [Syntrophobacteraceae bacterium]|nr:carotenoid 1,2-hydratase [Syntrophobacteraceae bacterium]
MTVASSASPPPSSASSESGFKSVSGDCDLQFPRDHGAHPGYQTEWWYYTGNLESDTGSRHGFQLTFFRRQTAPLEDKDHWPKPASPWRTLQLYFAHAAVSDLSGERFTHREKMSRGALNLAGVRQDSPETTEIFLEDWSARIGTAFHLLSASSDDFDIQLSLKPVKGPVLHGNDGYSLKGSTPDKASCYYSLTRMEASGSLVIAGRKSPVSGTAWMDHEFSSAPLETVYVGWDWFSLQLSDKTELMVYLLRRKDGSFGPASSGTHVDPSGVARHLGQDDFTMEILDSWKSPRSGATYPAGWRLRVPHLQMDLTIHPNLPDQELQTEVSTRITYWEGSVSAEGTLGRQPVQAVGYVELTGYAHPLEALH